jgi:hypothetical protein
VWILNATARTEKTTMMTMMTMMITAKIAERNGMIVNAIDNDNY